MCGREISRHQNCVSGNICLPQSRSISPWDSADGSTASVLDGEAGFRASEGGWSRTTPSPAPSQEADPGRRAGPGPGTRLHAALPQRPAPATPPRARPGLEGLGGHLPRSLSSNLVTPPGPLRLEDTLTGVAVPCSAPAAARPLPGSETGH